MTDEQFQAMLDIHTVVPFRMIRAVAPHMREPAKAERDRGEEVFRKIVNITSISGTMGNAGQANYSSGKAGVTGLTKTLAKEWGQFKVNVTRSRSGSSRRGSPRPRRRARPSRRARAARMWRSASPSRCAQMASDAHPARPARSARGGRRAGPLPRLTAVQLRPRPDHQRHRRPVRGHVHLVALPETFHRKWRSPEPACCVLGHPRTDPVRGLPASLPAGPVASPFPGERSEKDH